LSLRKTIKELKKQIKPKISAKFVYDIAEVDSSLESVVWVVYKK